MQLKKQLLKQTKQLNILKNINIAIQKTLDFDSLLHIILTTVTAGYGFGFNRAILFLISADGKTMEGKVGIGSMNELEGLKKWENSVARKITLSDLLDLKESKIKDIQLNDVIKEISISLENQEHIFSKSIADQRPYTVQDPDFNDVVQKLLTKKLGMTSFSVVPMITQGKAVGVIIVDNNIRHERIDTDDIDSLIPLMIQAACAVQNILLYKQTQVMSITDGLTELYNQRFYQQVICECVQTAQEKEEDLSVLVLDIDFFKNYNDTHGHLAGNAVLTLLAKLIKTIINVESIPCRFGGDEFVIILPKISKKVALATAEKIRTSIEQFEFPYQNTQPGGTLTVSVGISFLLSDMNSEMLLQCADLALYEAKKNGKNQVCNYERNEQA